MRGRDRGGGPLAFREGVTDLSHTYTFSLFKPEPNKMKLVPIPPDAVYRVAGLYYIYYRVAESVAKGAPESARLTPKSLLTFWFS